MKYLFFSLLIFLNWPCFAQEKEVIKPTQVIEVTGDLKENKKLGLADLSKFGVHEVGDLIIYNHLGEKKGTQKQMKGVLVKDVLADLAFNTPSPRQLSEFYFTIKASDGYTVVFSWNELFNSPNGDHVFFITEKEGVPMDKMKESILLVTTTDFKTGRRNVKAVDRILVSRAQ